MVPLYKKEAYAKMRNAKIRLSNMKLQFDGDSIDRELVRDIIFKIRDKKAKTEHEFNFKINV
jgi:hypothetical protein